MSSVKIFHVLMFAAALPCVVFGISDSCLSCICHVESGCSANVICGDGGASCGPYQIQRAYWSDAGSPGSGYRACVDTFWCSENTVRAYMNRYATYRLLGRSPTCEDYARIHNGGPSGYMYSSTDGYWAKIQNQGCTASS